MPPLPFAEALSVARSRGLASQKEWQAWCKAGMRPSNVHSNPHKFYKDGGWQGWGHWLGTGNVNSANKEFLPFEEALAAARSLGLANKKEWEVWRKSGARPPNVPSAPDRIYKDHGWQGLGHWLGTGNQQGNQHAKAFLPFNEALVVARSLRLTTSNEWRAWSKSGARPTNVPSKPSEAYKDYGWQGLKHWLGTPPDTAAPRTSSSDTPRPRKRSRVPPPPTTDNARAPGGGKRARKG